jgi:hypothetical protein
MHEQRTITKREREIGTCIDVLQEDDTPLWRVDEKRVEYLVVDTLRMQVQHTDIEAEFSREREYEAAFAATRRAEQ